MSALGQKQTYAVQQGMSALPPKATAKADMPHYSKADMCSALPDVCFGPKADIPPPHSITSSAVASSAGGTATPSAFAHSRLSASTNLVGCSTGRSAGFVPFTILST